MRNRISATESVIQKALKIVNQNNQQRTKREAPLYFIGQISRILFGTLDQEQGQKLHDIATKAYNKSIDIAKLLLNQTEIISAKLSDLETHISKFDKQLESIKHIQSQIKLDLAVMNTFSIIKDAILDFEFEAQTLTEAIISAQSGSIHPQFMSPEQLEH